jgi:hypothetical protein
LGTLYSQPIIQQSGNYTSFTVILVSVSMSTLPPQTITNASFSEPVVLESSTTLIYLPDAVARSIYTGFGAVYNTSISGNAWVDCKYRNSSYMTFGFASGSAVNVPYSELISDNAYFLQFAPKGLPFTDVCFLGILPGGS